MNITKHFQDRYAERILGCKDLLAARQYVNSNPAKVTEDINKLYEYSELIWIGQCGGDKTTKNFRYNNGVIIVQDVTTSNLVTLYKVDFSFGKDIDKVISAKLITEIGELRQKAEEEKQKVDETIKEKKAELESINVDLDNLKDQVKLLEFKKLSKENEIESVTNEIRLINKQIDQKAMKLCNSLEYKKDLEMLCK